MAEIVRDEHPWQGFEVRDPSGQRVGKVDEVFLSRADHRPEWLAVSTGPLGLRRAFVPVAGARQLEQAITVAYPAEVISSAPRPHADPALEPADEELLFRHYGLQPAAPVTSPDIPVPVAPLGAPSGPDDAMTRSEEELQVEKAVRPVERVRLVKHVVVEERQITVPVLHEEIRLERAVVPAGAGSTAPGPADVGVPGALATGDQTILGEFTLYEEEVIVTKRVVPKERVRLSKEVVTEERHVRDEVRKEQIDVEGSPVR